MSSAGGTLAAPLPKEQCLGGLREEALGQLLRHERTVLGRPGEEPVADARKALAAYDPDKDPDQSKALDVNMSAKKLIRHLNGTKEALCGGVGIAPDTSADDPTGGGELDEDAVAEE